MKRLVTLACGLALVAAGCSDERVARREPNPLEAPPIDTTRVRSAEAAASWSYRTEHVADLDGDGQDERIVLAADVTLAANGTPLWEDGHRWAAWVESPGTRTLLYAAFVPNGFVEAAALRPDDKGKRKVLVQERSRSQLRALEIEYRAPGTARLTSAAYYQVDAWLPGSAAMSSASGGRPAIETDRTMYELLPGRVGREARIFARFRASRNVFLTHCNGAIPWGLQRLVEGRWVDAWGAETNGCLSTPIALRAGEVRVDTLFLVSRDDVPRGRGTVQARVVPGTYRVAWYGVLTAFDPEARPFGPELPVEERVSGPITIRESGSP
jgi:hypothetical protein